MSSPLQKKARKNLEGSSSSNSYSLSESLRGVCSKVISEHPPIAPTAFSKARTNLEGSSSSNSYSLSESLRGVCSKVISEHPPKHCIGPKSYKQTVAIQSQVFDLFLQHSLSAQESVQLLHDIEKKMGFKIKKNIDVQNAVEAQFKSLEELSDRRSLVKLLTHSSGKPNEDILDFFPFLRSFSEHVFHHPERQMRSDKIDLTFVSNFMHDYCRYVDIA